MNRHAKPSAGRGTLLLLGILTAACLALSLLLLEDDPSSRLRQQQPRPSAPETARVPAPSPSAVRVDPTPASGGDAAAQPAAAQPPQQVAQAPRPRRSTRRARPLPKLGDGTVDFAALGLTGKEPGAELLRTEETRRPARLEYGFQPGDAWVVETYYRNMQNGRGDSWSDAVYWRFEVVDQGRFQGQPALVVRATMQDAQGTAAPGATPATFYVDPQSQRLLGADLTETRAGRQKSARVTYDGDGGSHATGSIVPFDLPPPGIEGRLCRSGGALPRLEPVDAASRALFPGRGALLGAGGEYLEVEFKAPDGTTVRQRWSLSDLRWPTETITEHWRSYRRKLS